MFVNDAIVRNYDMLPGRLYGIHLLAVRNILLKQKGNNHVRTKIRQYGNTAIRQYGNTAIRQYGNTAIRQYFKWLVSTLACLFPLFSWAAPCSPHEQDKAAYYAEKQGAEIVEQYNGGRNIRTRITACDFNSFSQQYQISLDVYWNGVITDKIYNSSGTLKMNASGSGRQYSETWRNENLKEYAGWRSFLNLTHTAIKAANEYHQQPKVVARPKPVTWIAVHNSCGTNVELLVKYKDYTSGTWLVKKWMIPEGDGKQPVILKKDGVAAPLNETPTYAALFIAPGKPDHPIYSDFIFSNNESDIYITIKSPILSRIRTFGKNWKNSIYKVDWDGDSYRAVRHDYYRVIPNIGNRTAIISLC